MTEEREWDIVRAWSTRIHQWAEEGLTPFGLSCRGIKAPLVYVIYEDRVEPQGLQAHQKDQMIQHLRDRARCGEGLGVVLVEEMKMNGVQDGEVRSKCYDTLIVCAWGGKAHPTRYYLLAQGFVREQGGRILLFDPNCHTGYEDLCADPSEVVEGSWLSGKEGRS